MIVTFKTISGTTIRQECHNEQTIGDLKQVLASITGLSLQSMRLVRSGRALVDDQTVATAGIDETGFVVLFAPKICPKTAPPTVPITIPESHAPPHIPEPETESHTIITPSSNQDALPELEDGNAKYDPVTFDADIAQLELLGFGRGECSDALRAAAFDPELAASYLLEGIPSLPSLERRLQDESEDSINEVKRTLELVRSGKIAYDDFRVDLETHFPNFAFVLLRNPVGFFVDLGFDPGDFSWHENNRQPQTIYDALIEGFTTAEKETILRLSAHGFDTMTVIQVFNACQKDECETLTCLKSMAG